MPRVPTIGAVLLLVSMRSPKVVVVQLPSHARAELFLISSSLLGNGLIVAVVQEPVSKVGSASVAETIGIVGWSAVRDTTRGFGVGVAEGMCLENNVCNWVSNENAGTYH